MNENLPNQRAPVDPMRAFLAERFDSLLREPDLLFVPRAENDALKARFRAALEGGNMDAADAALTTLTERCRYYGSRHRWSAAASRFRGPQSVIDAIEGERRKLRLGPDGIDIECVGGTPANPWAVDALKYHEADVRAILAARETVVVLVRGSR